MAFDMYKNGITLKEVCSVAITSYFFKFSVFPLNFQVGLYLRYSAKLATVSNGIRFLTFF